MMTLSGSWFGRGTRRLAPLVPALGLCLACFDANQDPTFPRHTLGEWVKADEHRPDAAGSGQHDSLTLYLDGSASMKGYADPGATFEYSRALQAAAALAEKSSSNALQMRRVDTEVKVLPATGETLWQASRTQTFYNGTASNIAAAIRALAPAGSRPAAGDSRAFLFVTDGVQDLAKNTLDPLCSAGAEPRCVNGALAALIDEGWGVHIFAVRSRFDGTFYSEMHGGGPIGRYRAVGAGDASRYRPFLILVLCEDRDVLPGLVDGLREALQESGISPSLIHELPLTLPLVKVANLTLETEIYSIKDPLRGGEAVANPIALRGKDAWREDFDGKPLGDRVQILEYAWNDANFLQPCAVRITANLALTSAGEILFGRAGVDPGSLLQPLTVRQVQRPKGWYLPAQHLVWPPDGHEARELQFDGTLREGIADPFVVNEPRAQAARLPRGGGHLLMHWSGAGDYLPRTLLRLDGLLDPAKVLLPGWVREWSTDNDSELASGNRIFNLYTLVRGLQKNERIANQGLPPWYLVIWPTKS